MQSFDVLIVGAGPAGSSLAYYLKDTPLSVAIMDKHFFPRNKVCAGWVTPEVFRLLNIAEDEYAQGRVLQKINGFNVSLIGQTHQQVSDPEKTLSYGIRRFEFDDYLLRRCGAFLLTGEPFKNMKKNAGGDKTWLVNGQYQASIVVGAGGNFCPVARLLNDNDNAKELTVVAQEIEFEMSTSQQKKCTVNRQVPELFFSKDLRGYGWVFRKGNYLNIGLGRVDPTRLSSRVKEFCEYLSSRRKIPPDIAEKFKGHCYVMYPNSTRKIIGDHTLLIGDAAGLAYAKSGEGIRPAVESAVLAAEVINNNQNGLSKYDHNKNFLQEYQNLVESRYGKRTEQHTDPSFEKDIGLPIDIKNFLVHQFLKTNWFIKNFVINKWFLRNHMKPISMLISSSSQAESAKE